MKVVFLDFDGVLNSDRSFEFYRTLTIFDISSIQALNKVVNKTQAKVVITSSWRMIYTLSELRLILLKAGFEGEVIGRTPVFTESVKRRSDEIAFWLNRHKDAESFVILDDCPIRRLQQNQVLTSMATGFQEAEAEKAVEMLNRC